jgi:hypothetical protein
VSSETPVDADLDLAAAESAVLDEVRVAVKFRVRAMSETVRDVCGRGQQPPRAVSTDRDAGRFAVDDLEGRFVQLPECGGFLELEPATGCWVRRSADLVRRAIATEITNTPLRWTTPGRRKEAAADPHTSMPVAMRIADVAMAMLPQDATLPARVVASAEGRLFFHDGFWCARTRAFETFEGSDVMTGMRMPGSFPAAPTDAERADLFRRVIDAIFPLREEGQAYLASLARALLGFMDKRWVVLLGHRNCGKGILTRLALNAFRPYAINFAANDLLRGRGGCEPARALTFAIPFEFARLAIANEIDEGVANLVVNGTLLKQLASGGDAVLARDLYSRTRQFVPRALLVINANTLPRVVPACADLSMVQFTGYTTFVREVTAEHEAEMAREGNRHRYLVGDDTIHEYINLARTGEVFQHVVLEAFRDTADVIPASLQPPRTDDDEQAVRENVLYTARTPISWRRWTSRGGCARRMASRWMRAKSTYASSAWVGSSSRGPSRRGATTGSHAFVGPRSTWMAVMAVMGDTTGKCA